MFKKEINFISDLNLNKLQVIGDRFTIQDLKSSRIHPAILHFINSAIDKEIFADRKKIEDNSIFDYKTDRINNYFVLISEEIKRTQHFELKYLKPLVQNAIVFNINFLTSPNKTLVQSIFGNLDITPIEEIVLGISQAYYYRYLQKILLTYLEKKKVLSLSKNEFVQLLERVDSISRETHLEDTLVTAVNSITNFFDQNSKTPEKLPIKAIELYLEEKELTEFSTRLDTKFIADSSTLFLGTDILNVLRSVTPETEIILDEIENKEEELIVDDSVNETLNFSKNDIIQSKQSDEVDLVAKDDIFEVSDDEIDIPNNEILSSDEIVTEIEVLKEDSDDVTIFEEDFEELDKEKYEIESRPNGESNVDNDVKEQSDEVSQKKKPDGISLLNKLIDVNPLFDSLLSSVKPFENYEDRLNLIESIKSKSEEFNYKIDISNLSETLEFSSDEKQELEKDEIKVNRSENVVPTESSTELSVLDTDNREIEESKPDSINELNSEEYLSANETLEVLENESNSDNTFDLPDEEHDEITEVFKDLTFLDQEDEEDISIKSEVSFTDNINENLIDQNSEDSQSEENNFFSSLLSKDMSKIIESVFDYDMEEYYSIINEVSQTNNEEEANKIFDEFCLKNHIELDLKEVESFRTMISQYFTKTYS